jgi:hypothetical protein
VACDEPGVDLVDGDAVRDERHRQRVHEVGDRHVEQGVELVVVKEADDARQLAFQGGAYSRHEGRRRHHGLS